MGHAPMHYTTGRNPSGLTVALGTTPPPGNFLGIRGGLPTREANNLTAICEPLVKQMWDPRRLTNLCASTFCYLYKI
jgi:hypothetical protein